MQEHLLRTSGHAAFALQYHLVFVTKYRHKCLTAEMLEQLRVQFLRVCLAWRCELTEFNGEADHVHLLVTGHPTVALSRLVGNLKTVSARYMRAAHAQHLKKFFWKKIFWSGAYAAFTVGAADLATVIRYIQEQESPALPSTGK
ncbi:MAG: IS200/IS605 family transposase [Agitococcus sp.]|nr:IS200/IS605 family transposase [Agitococcus sp.]